MKKRVRQYLQLQNPEMNGVRTIDTSVKISETQIIVTQRLEKLLERMTNQLIISGGVPRERDDGGFVPSVEGE